MKIAIIGAGNVGGTLGTRWAQAGHEVIFGARDLNSEKIRSVLASSPKKIQAAHIKEAVAAAEVVVLAAPWSVTQTIIETAGDLTDKIVVDCTNPIAEGMQGLALGLNTSGGEQVAAWAKGANVVKAFNMTGSGNMANPVYGDQKASMFICGDNLDAKQVVTHLAEELGFEVVDSGPIVMSRYLEPFALLWVSLAFMQGLGPNIAFKLLKR